MDEYIEKAELIKNLCFETAEWYYSPTIKTIKEFPAADVQPARHGRWECVGHDDKTYWYRCSVCGHEEHDNMTKHDNYCGSCGARMDGDAE